MLDSEKFRNYMNISRDVKFYQSKEYGQIHDMDLRMHEMKSTVASLPDLMETLMMADIHMNSADISDAVKRKFKLVRSVSYEKIAEAMIGLCGIDPELLKDDAVVEALTEE